MPRYFFDIGGDDASGTVFAGDATARNAGRVTFVAMIRGGAVEDGGFMEVVDASGRRVAMLRFSVEQ